MKLYRITALLVIVALIVPLCAFGAEYDGLNKVQKDARALDKYLKKGTDIAYRITELTGVALSPLVCLVVVGGIDYYKAKVEKRPVKWYFSLWFLGALILILVLIALKDTIGEAVHVLKKPLDALDFVQHKFSGILAFSIVAPQLVLALLAPVGQTTSYLLRLIDPVAPAYAGQPGFMEGGMLTGTVLAVAIIVCVLIAALYFLIIWLAAGAVETLILLSPIPFVGVILRGFRLSILGVLGLGVIISPVIGILISLVILYVSYRILGWSFRLSVFGWMLVYDPLTGQKNYVDLKRERHLKAFSSPEIRDVKNRSYGRLVKEGKDLVFEYRPWLVFPRRRVVAPEPLKQIGIARGTLFPSVVAMREGHRRHPALYQLAPRYKGHEEGIARLLGVSPEIHDQRFHRRFVDAWRWIMGQLSNGSPAVQPA